MDEVNSQGQNMRLSSDGEDGYSEAALKNNKKRERKIANLPLIVVLVVLGLMAVGLLIGISFSLFGSKTNEVDDGVSDVDCSKLNAYDEIEECIAQRFDENGDLEERIYGYSSAIGNAISSGDYELAAQLIDTGTEFLVRYNECEKAVNGLSELDLSGFDDSQRIKVYETALNASKQCEYMDAEQRYSELLRGLTMEGQGEE